MELFSSSFFPAVLKVLKSNIPLLASIPIPKSGRDIPAGTLAECSYISRKFVITCTYTCLALFWSCVCQKLHLFPICRCISYTSVGYLTSKSSAGLGGIKLG